MLYKNKYRVESARRPDWDYAAAGFYFVTICTRDRYHYFGEIVESPETPQMVLSDIGRVAERFWLAIPQQFPFVRLDEFVVMPNHVHGIIQISANHRDAMNDADSDAINRVSTGVPRNPMIGHNSISSIIRWYKGRVTFEIRQIQTAIPFAWQSRFHDHIIRTESELDRIRQYIQDNPSNWATDDENL